MAERYSRVVTELRYRYPHPRSHHPIAICPLSDFALDYELISPLG